MNNKWEIQLDGGDLRSNKPVNEIVKIISTQEDFDALFENINHTNKAIAFRAADAIEKITLSNPRFLIPHKDNLLKMLSNATDKEIKWHLTHIVPRLPLKGIQIATVTHIFIQWCLNKNESKVVRANALQALFQLSQFEPTLKTDISEIIEILRNENIPSINARIKKLEKKISIKE